HVASLLAMTIVGGKVHCSFHRSRFGLGRALAMTVGDGPPRHVAALLPYNTRLSLRRRVADCGNPREGKDQMDRHVASLLAMTGGGRSSLPAPPHGLALVRALAMTNVCSLKGAKPLRQSRGAELVDARRTDGSVVDAGLPLQPLRF